jgi:hypothetical protein
MLQGQAPLDHDGNRKLLHEIGCSILWPMHPLASLRVCCINLLMACRASDTISETSDTSGLGRHFVIGQIRGDFTGTVRFAAVPSIVNALPIRPPPERGV